MILKPFNNISVKESYTGQVIFRMSVVSLIEPEFESMFVTYNHIIELD